ncbi:phosphoglycerate mutase family protein [Luteimonas suaedae]|uniref:phosphoglycerate mutase family protein n=1 Tax=Luteimonas suaedae TaxID=2605430 RepID=UPI001659E774|nr:phosphoglycerate mutase family protein [Luteimonas suaedae]
MRPIILLLSLMLAGCAAQPARAPSTAVAPPDPPQTAFLVVRHAEKVTGDTDDPVLDAPGQRRADALAELLAEMPVSAVYATPTRRARQTALPIAQRHGLEVRDYDPAQPPSAFATVLHTRHAGATVVVVGHSNTVPGIVSALCACPVAPLTEQDYGDLFEVRIAADGASTLDHRRF